MNARTYTRALAVDVSPDGKLPTEFRIFREGVNETTKGTTLFDAESARAVMSAWQKQGVDLMIDLEHQALDKPSQAARADAPDARGWFRLELRGGELWAVNVTWTPDGERRLREKTQRYISPAFVYDVETGRAEEILNVALTAMPATHDAQPLVAASKREARARALAALTLCATLIVCEAYTPKKKANRR